MTEPMVPKAWAEQVLQYERQTHAEVVNRLRAELANLAFENAALRRDLAFNAGTLADGRKWQGPDAADEVDR